MEPASATTSTTPAIVPLTIPSKRALVTYNEGVSDRSQAYLQGPRMKLSASLMAPSSSANMIRKTEKLNDDDSPPSSPERPSKSMTPQPYLTMIEDTTCKECEKRFDNRKERDTHVRILHQDRVRVKRYGEGGLYETIERSSDGLYHCRCPFMNPDPQALRQHLTQECQAYHLKEPSKPIWEPVVPRRVDAYDGQVQGKRKRIQLKKFEPGQTDTVPPPRPRPPRVKPVKNVPEALVQKQKKRAGQMNKLGNAYNNGHKNPVPYGQKLISAQERLAIKIKERQESRERIRKAVMERRKLERQMAYADQISVTYAPEPRSTRNSKAENFKFYNTDGANNGLDGRFWNKAAGIGKIGSIDTLNDDPSRPLPWDGVSRRRPTAASNSANMTRGGKLAQPNRMPSPKNGDLIVISSSEESVVAIPNDYSADTPSETTSSEGSDFKAPKALKAQANRKARNSPTKRRRIESSEIGSTDSSIQLMQIGPQTNLRGEAVAKRGQASASSENVKSKYASQVSSRFEKIEDDDKVIKSISTVNHSLNGNYWSDLPLPGQRRQRKSKLTRKAETSAPIKVTSNYKPGKLIEKFSVRKETRPNLESSPLSKISSSPPLSDIAASKRTIKSPSVASTALSEEIERHAIIVDTSPAPESIASSSDGGVTQIPHAEGANGSEGSSADVRLIPNSADRIMPIVVYDSSESENGADGNLRLLSKLPAMEESSGQAASTSERNLIKRQTESLTVAVSDQNLTQSSDTMMAD